MRIDLQSLTHEQLLATLQGVFNPRPAVASHISPLPAALLPTRTPDGILYDASSRTELSA